MSFNDDGTINKITPTYRGIGICDAKRQIQIDRYSAISKTGAFGDFLDSAKRGDGWKITLNEKDAFVQYDRVQFGKTPFKTVKVRANSSAGGSIEIRIDKPDSPVIARVNIPAGAEFQTISTALSVSPTDLHNLIVSQPAAGSVELDWVAFE